VRGGMRGSRSDPFDCGAQGTGDVDPGPFGLGGDEPVPAAQADRPAQLTAEAETLA